MLQPMRHTTKRGFSLIELLVVILIIAIVIAIIVPSLGSARIAARKVTTAALLNNITNGAETFAQDHGGKMPGYYTPQEVGTFRNKPGRDGGFTAMENALLDLVAGDAIIGESGVSSGGYGGGGGSGQDNILGSVGPQGNAGGRTRPRNLKIDLNLIGTGNSYLDLDADTLKAASGQNASKDHQAFPDVVDSFGNPVLAWVEDPSAPAIPTAEAEFATEDSRNRTARYYWNSNAAWLTSTSLGKGGKDQTLDAGSDQYGSLLNLPDDAEESLTAVLGNPNFPTPTDHTPANVLPSATRGGFVVHSAGADGIYFGVKDNGTRALGIKAGSGKPLQYAFNFYPEGKDGSQSNRWKDDNGLPITIDLTKGFDDLITSTSN